MRLERWWFKFRARVKSLLGLGHLERDLDDELQFHLENKVDQGIREGLSPDEARDAAMRAMDGFAQRKEQMRDTRRIHWFSDFVGDAQYAIRSLDRSRGLTLFVVASLALGIGLASAAYSMMDALIFRPYPVPDHGSVVSLVSTTHDQQFGSFSYREYLDIRDKTTSYSGMVANKQLEVISYSPSPGATPRVKAGMLVSGNYFRVLGVEPKLGRGFREEEDRVPGRDAVAVLAPYFWKQEFGSDPSVIGRKIRLNGAEFTIIGVAPESFPGMLIFMRPDFYVPLAMAGIFSTDGNKNFFEDRDDRELIVKARLKPDTRLQAARNELAMIAKNFEQEYPKTNRGRGSAVHTQFEMRTQDDDVNWKFSVIITILGLALLLLACTNIAGLLLSRARARTREIAVRLSLGAGRFRLVRMLLTESLILSCLGGATGIAVAYAAIAFLRSLSFPSDLPVMPPFQLDTRVLLVCLALAICSAIFFGLAPALQSSRADLINGLRATGASESGRKRLWGRNVLVAVQVSISLMLLTASFLMIRGFENGVQEGIGFAKEHLLMAKFDPRLVQYNGLQTEQFYKLLTQRAQAIPGVRGAALMQNPPLGLDNFASISFVPEGFQMPPGRENFVAAMDTINDGYFTTLGIPILRGRGFLSSDTVDSRRVAIVNEQFAKHYWHGSDAVGKRLLLDNRLGEAVEIVGIAKSIKYTQTIEKPMDFVYLPLAQRPVARLVLLLRTSRDPLQFASPLKDAVRTLNPYLPVIEMRTYEDLYRYSVTEGPNVAMGIVGTMGFIGLLLAIAGLYGLVAYNVSRRTREIGIRMAIGATPGNVIRLIMSNGILLVGIGTAVGLVMSLLIEQMMNSMLFNAGGVDAMAYLAVVPMMILVTMLAAYLPARRASQTAPTQALRCE